MTTSTERWRVSTPDSAAAGPSALQRAEHVAAPGTVGIIAAAAVLGAAVVLLATSKYGAAAISDSAAYISMARNVVEGQGFTASNGELVAMWPPLYPALLAVFEIIGADAMIAARWINAFLLATLAGITGFSLWRLTREPTVAVAVAFATALAPALLDYAIAVMSEPLFVLLVVSCLLVLARHLWQPNRWDLGTAALLAAGAWLTRYAGFALVGAACVLLLARRGRPISVALREATMFGTIASLPMAAWLARNYVLTGTFTGGRYGSPFSIGHLAQLALERVGQWFVPSRVGPLVAGALGGAVLAVALAVVARSGVRAVRRNDSRPPWWTNRTETAAVVFALFTVVYVASLIWILSVSFATDDPKRLLAPAVPTSLIVLGIVLAQTKHRRHGPLLVGLASALFLIWPARYALGLVRFTRQHGAGGVSSDFWQQSGIINHLKQNATAMRRDRAMIYSNEPTAIYLLTGLQPIYWLPPHDSPASPLPPRESLEAFARRLPRRDPTYVALFDAALDDYKYAQPLFEATLAVEPVHRARDGVLYRVKFSDSDTGTPATFR